MIKIIVTRYIMKLIKLFQKTGLDFVKTEAERDFETACGC